MPHQQIAEPADCAEHPVTAAEGLAQGEGPGGLAAELAAPPVDSEEPCKTMANLRSKGPRISSSAEGASASRVRGLTESQERLRCNCRDRIPLRHRRLRHDEAAPSWAEAAVAEPHGARLRIVAPQEELVLGRVGDRLSVVRLREQGALRLWEIVAMSHPRSWTHAGVTSAHLYEALKKQYPYRNHPRTR